MTDDGPLLGNKTFSGVSSFNVEPFFFLGCFFSTDCFCLFLLFLNLINSLKMSIKEKSVIVSGKTNHSSISRERKKCS